MIPSAMKYEYALRGETLDEINKILCCDEDFQTKIYMIVDLMYEAGFMTGEE